MKPRCYDSKIPVGCLRVYVRVDWNIPLQNGLGAEDSLKLSRSYPLLKQLQQAGAITFVLTHLGRPKKREAAFSTKPLAKIVSAHSGLPIQWLDTDLSSKSGKETFVREIDRFQPGDIVLLENVRFQKGEETNDVALVKAYADHADVFINDAFASCHRNHATVTGLAKALPSFAGPALCQEIAALLPLVPDGVKVRRPYIAVIGGAKLSTKIPVLKALLGHADKVLVGGAMAHAFFAAKNITIGKSYIEKEGIAMAKKIIKNSKLLLPIDVLVAKKPQQPKPGEHPRAVKLKEIGKTDYIVDIGPETMRAWAAEINKAKTVVWNGPLGMTEVPAFSYGSLMIGRAIAARAKGKAYGVAGGGDTLPVLQRTGMQEWFDFISTGGGAMMEFFISAGKLPGILPLMGAQKKRVPKLPRSPSIERGISCSPLDRVIIPAPKRRKKQ